MPSRWPSFKRPGAQCQFTCATGCRWTPRGGLSKIACERLEIRLMAHKGPIQAWDYLAISTIVPSLKGERISAPCALCREDAWIDPKGALYTAPRNCSVVCDACGGPRSARGDGARAPPACVREPDRRRRRSRSGRRSVGVDVSESVLESRSRAISSTRAPGASLTPTRPIGVLRLSADSGIGAHRAHEGARGT